MRGDRIQFGLMLANRGVTFGATTPAQMLEMAEIAERSGLYASVWAGDSLLGRPRMESITLLSAVAARTQRVRLGPGCMSSFPLRDPVQLAYQWASLDLISAGRTILVACTGIGPLEGHQAEARQYGVTPGDRAGRLVESIQVLQRLWTEDHVTFTGKYYLLDDVSVGPKPAQQPHPPIWIANNPKGSPALVERLYLRVARHADGWFCGADGPEAFVRGWAGIQEQARQLGRDPSELETALYHNINVNDDREAAYDETKRFMDLYYETDYRREALDRVVTYGPAEECIAKLRRYAAAGMGTITLRCTSWDQLGQLRRCLEEVLPFV